MLVIWSTLQLTSNLWFIVQQFTARADLFLKQIVADNILFFIYLFLLFFKENETLLFT